MWYSTYCAASKTAKKDLWRDKNDRTLLTAVWLLTRLVWAFNNWKCWIWFFDLVGGTFEFFKMRRQEAIAPILEPSQYLWKDKTSFLVSCSRTSQADVLERAREKSIKLRKVPFIFVRFLSKSKHCLYQHKAHQIILLLLQKEIYLLKMEVKTPLWDEHYLNHASYIDLLTIWSECTVLC